MILKMDFFEKSKKKYFVKDPSLLVPENEKNNPSIFVKKIFQNSFFKNARLLVLGSLKNYFKANPLKIHVYWSLVL